MTDAHRGAVGGGAPRQDNREWKKPLPARSDIATQAIPDPDPFYVPYNIKSKRPRRTKAIARRRRLLAKMLDLMAPEGRRLIREHQTGGVRWFINPGSIHVPDEIARRIIKCADVEPLDAGLFPGSDVAQYLRVMSRIVAAVGKSRAR
jgi:hypothetical protein